MSMRHKRSEPKRRGLTSKVQQYYSQDPERSYSLRPFDEWLRRYLCSSASCSRDNQLFSLRRMNSHVIVFGPFFDVIKFVDKSSYARRTYQQTGIICKFGHGILFMPSVEVQCRHHI